MKYFFFSVLFLFVLLSRGFFPVYGQISSSIEDKIKEYETKISDLQNQENTLFKQIGILNSQIEMTALRISSLKDVIAKLTLEISELKDEIDRLEGLLTKRSELVLHRIPESYKRTATPQFGILLLSSNVSDFILRVKYITRVQQEDMRLLAQVQSTQDLFSEQKDRREKKKAQQEAYKKQIEDESRKLDRQKKEKQSLLEQTKNSESVYQTLLAQALAEKQAIERAIIEGVRIGPVKKGDAIAHVGNTGYPGCSTGAHLHFEIRKNNAWVNVEEYLSGREVNDQQSGTRWKIGSGDWEWPLAGDITMTQRFGKTPYSWRYSYSGGIHTGVDMVSSNSIIYAPRDGILYSSSQTCGDTSIIKIKYIEHTDGIVSFYLHVQ